MEENSSNIPQIPFASSEATPQHVAIIMDGNRRWATDRNLPYIDGHKEALKRIEEIIEYAAKKGIKYLTLWAWSTKNWSRNKSFIDDIITLFRLQLGDDGLFARAAEKGAKLHHIGTLEGFPKDIVNGVKNRLMKDPVKKVIDVNLAVGYEGRDEIVRAVRKIIEAGKAASEVTQDLISEFLDTSGQPDVDLMIRTGGDYRTSGFLVWQIADAELSFPQIYMPDFTTSEFQKSLDDYANRERRMGGDSKKY